MIGREDQCKKIKRTQIHNCLRPNHSVPFLFKPYIYNLTTPILSQSSKLGFFWVSRRAPSDMGGGNGQKAKMARERNLDKQKAAAKGSQLESNKKAMSIQCKVCMQTFMCTTSEVKCREHAEAKHPKSDVNACFPHLKK
ncbi:hypothetical protein VNO77_25187 [Canavalia gladiata]|uniref:Zinc finger protein 706 n=1 Tax=Canavalia gladiata TaxID=3824 RepID=A0AAN9QAP2_CANGL